MKKYWFIVTLVTGVTFTQMGEGWSRDAALMDACIQLTNNGINEDLVDNIN